MTNGLFLGFSRATEYLNRGLAWLDFGVHYVSGYLIYYLIGGVKPQYHTRPNKAKGYAPSVVVTGASEGIGLATSLHLSAKGYTVFAAIKDSSELPKLKDAIASQSKPLSTIHPIIMDVLSPDSITHAAEEIASHVSKDDNTPLMGVVNNAGYCMISPMEFTREEDVRNIFEMDFWAYIRVCKAFLPLIKPNKGRIINVGSYGGYVNPPMWAPYSAIKAGIEGMTRAWRVELRPFGVGMCTVRPGWTRSHGIGPKISKAWESYFDQVSEGAIGVTSFGDVVKGERPMTKQEENIYNPMMSKWYKLITAAADGLGNSSEAVAQTIHDAMTDVFLQPYYTVGYDALLGQMARDLTPETIYETQLAKTFG